MIMMKDGQKCFFCNKVIGQTKEVLFRDKKKDRNCWSCRKCGKKIKSFDTY